ncbi:sugar ABC transporter permease [Rubrobacter taiwanensis]|uniref:Sugar ABC transporter permease n=1 Tax=Rubrobacter taiwanensis TaxID=185139 RepID=A0A4R1BLZ1_9ACTN|nr:sugar ABC transporter permease [Rubrobacter taiwanensis]TCJ18357.1 sugar ABC transporter permease [Rubrobacter taiwanensis]
MEAVNQRTGGQPPPPATKTPRRWNPFRGRVFEDVTMAYLFLLPTLAVMAVFVFGPIFYAFWVSLHDWPVLGANRPFVGIENYAYIIGQDEVFRTAFWNSLYYTLGVVPVQTVVALGLAIVMNSGIRFRDFFRAAFFVPTVTSSAALAVIFTLVFSSDPNSIANRFIGLFGFGPLQWYTSASTALETIMFMNIFATVGQFMVIYLAGLQGVPRQLYEAAAIDGAGWWRRLWYITIPMLKPVTFLIVTLGIIGCWQVFDQIAIITEGGPEFSTLTVVYWIYREAFRSQEMGTAAAGAFILFVIIFVTVLIQRRIVGESATE